MPLRIFEQNLKNVPAQYRHLYLADAELGYRLDLVDLDDFVAGLKSALRKQRDDNKELRAQLGAIPVACKHPHQSARCCG